MAGKYFLTGQNPQSAMRIEGDEIEALQRIAFPAGNSTYTSNYRIVEAATGNTVCFSTKDGWNWNPEIQNG